MVKGISIAIGSDTREFSAGVKSGVVQPLEDVADALDDLGSDGDKAGSKLEKSLDDARKSAKELGTEGKSAGTKLERAMKDAEGETKDLGREHSKLGDVIDRESKRGSESLKRNTKEATTAAKGDLEELKNEAKQNAAETFSSFDGSTESFVDGIQGTLGGIVSSLGPVGMAAGAAGALLIGGIKGALDTAGENTEAYREKVRDLGSEYIDTAGIGEVSVDHLADKMKELALENKDAGDSLVGLRKDAAKTGHDFRDLAEAYAGNAEGLEDLVKINDEYLAQLKSEQQLIDSGAKKGDLNAIIEKIEAQQNIVDVLHQSADAARDAADSEAAYLAAGVPEMKAKAALVENIQGAVDDAASSWEEYQDKESGAIDPSAYLAGIQARTDAATAYAANLRDAQAQLSPEAYQYLVDQGIDFAPMLQSILDSGLVGEMNAQFSQAVDAGNTALTGIKSDIPVTVTTTADTKPAAADLFKVTSSKPETSILTKADTRPAQSAIAGVAGGTYSATIGTSVDLGGAESALNAFLNRTRTITVQVRGVTPDGKQVF